MRGRLTGFVVVVLVGCAGARPEFAQLEPIELGMDGSAPIGFADTSVAIPAGTALGAHHGGLLRIAQRAYTWGETFAGGFDGIAAAAADHLRARGYTVADRDAGEYRIDATVVELRYDTYSGFAGDRSDATVTVGWSVRDAARGEVVREVTTQGFGTQGGTGTDCLRPAFLSALDNLLADAAFVGEVRRAGAAPVDDIDEGAPIPIAGCQPAAELRLPGDLDRVERALVVVSAGEAVASGFSISTDGHVLTAATAVSDTAATVVRTASGLELPARVVRTDPELGVALLRIPGRGHACVAPDPDPTAGDQLFAIDATTRSIARGRLDALDRIVRTDAVFDPGHAGAPLLTSDGRVLAIVTFAGGTARCVPITEIARGLDLDWFTR